MQAEMFSPKVAPRNLLTTFEADALGYLIAYAKRHRGQAFGAEEVTLAATAEGIAPADLRAWGAVFTQAARDGYIRRSDKWFIRTMGNCTKALGWIGV